MRPDNFVRHEQHGPAWSLQEATKIIQSGIATVAQVCIFIQGEALYVTLHPFVPSPDVFYFSFWDAGISVSGSWVYHSI